ncbi:serine/threonine protein kinase [Nocardia anaemiae]|uniref:serine/threonine protein kinase n=1 Tax=Nocardia anaemiae TaxID=263910 RepID=UPI0007A449C6|nr:serine/threonine protein kinase [Nocardia anaemiae]
MDETQSRAGTRFGPYELRTLLGRGGMGEVYEAYDTVKDRVVAIKLLPMALADDPRFQQRFRHESRVAARLAEPHVIPIHDWGEIDGVLYIDMRLVRGSDLRSVLREKGPLSPTRAVGIIEQVASALDAAHAEGLVHRDVKPANILVTPSDFAYLADFGIARSERDPSVTATGQAIGSYSYIAPERFDTAPIGGTADVYSLACVLFECLTGTQPFPADGMSSLIRAHLSTPPPRPSTKRAGLPGTLDEVISRGMAKEPADRYPTAGALASAARAAVSATPSLPNSDAPTTQISNHTRPAPATIIFPTFGPESMVARQPPNWPQQSGGSPSGPSQSAEGPQQSGGPQSGGSQQSVGPQQAGGPPQAVAPPQASGSRQPAGTQSAGGTQQTGSSRQPGGLRQTGGPLQAAGGSQPPSDSQSGGPRSVAGSPHAGGPASGPQSGGPKSAGGPQQPGGPASARGVQSAGRPPSASGPESAGGLHPAGSSLLSGGPQQSGDRQQSGESQQSGGPQSVGGSHPAIGSRLSGGPQRSGPPPQSGGQWQAGGPTSANSPQRIGGAPAAGGAPSENALRSGSGPPQASEPRSEGGSQQAGGSHFAGGQQPVGGQHSMSGQPQVSGPQLSSRSRSHIGQQSTGGPRQITGLEPTLVPRHPSDPVRRDIPPHDATTEALSRTVGMPMPQSDAPYPPDPTPVPARRSMRIVWIGVVLAVLAIGGIVGWQVRDGSDGQPTNTMPAHLPAGAKPCAKLYPALGRFTSSAIGTTVTSCAFAEEVRRAYADGGDSTITDRSVMAHSPINNRDYQMNCTAGDQFATCSGGENAIVYVY